MAGNITIEELAVDLAEIKQMVKQDYDRLNKIERQQEQIGELTVAIKEIAVETKYMRRELNETKDSVSATNNRMDEYELGSANKGAIKWDNFKWIVFTLIVEALITYALVAAGIIC